MDFNIFKSDPGVDFLKKVEKSSPGMRGPYHSRKHINFGKGESYQASAEAKEFWDMMRRCFLEDEWFPALVYGKYREYFRLRFGDISEDADFLKLFVSELFLQRHEPGFYIGPHTDLPSRVFTAVFAFAEGEGFEEYGTQLMQHKDRLVQCWGMDHYEPDDFIVKKVAPYKPNNFLLFFKTRYAFHCVKPITADVPNQRYGMQFQFYEPYGGLFKDLSRPNLMLRDELPAAPAAPPPKRLFRKWR